MPEAEPSPDPVPPAAAPATRPSRGRLVVRAARRAGELLTVFVGVYAAFLLNNHQVHRQEQQRRGQILDWLEKEYTEDLEGIRHEQELLTKQADKFDRQVAAGEMPALYAFNFSSDYDPADLASVLGGGGFDLLEVETVREINEVEGILRVMVSNVRHDQQLSDTYVLPNLEKDRSFFYDPATRRLRPTYRWYTDFYQQSLANYAALQSGIGKLLMQIRAERKRNY